MAPEELALAGRISGILYLLGGATFALFALLPGIAHDLTAVLIIGASAALWGAGSLRLDWTRAPAWLMPGSTVASLIMISIGIHATGGAESMAWIYLFFVILFAAYFYTRLAAAVYLGLAILVHLSVLIYDHDAIANDRFIAQLVVAVAAYVSLALSIMAGKMLMLRLRRRAEQLAAEQSALRRVATAVVDGRSPEQIYALVSREAAQLLNAAGAGVLRLDESGATTTVLGSWSMYAAGRYAPGTQVPVREGSDVDRAIREGRPVRVTDHPPDSPVDRLGYCSSIVAPIRVGNRTWGVLAVAVDEGGNLTAEDEKRLEEVGDLLATAIASIEDRAKLAAQASTDPLTGVANHRTLHEVLAAEVSRARRTGSQLSVAVLDVDHFKHFNDTGGHEAGDRLLVAVADCLREVARSSDTLGRVGGDEFAWILPDTSREAALMAVERARQLVATQLAEPGRITVSAGICDLSVTQDPAELIRFADGALYWSKAHGRDQCWIYDPGVVAELSAQERAERLARSQALLGIRALARAIDAKDPATRQHSERVAALVHRMALIAGWSREQALLLSEAALVHDVGKIGVPDRTLRKPAPLTDEEWAQVRGHAELAAAIVEGVLAPEQVEWIRTHHERPDGSGYPHGLTDIPQGAALLALADAWDVMTVSRPYSVPKTAEEALAECRALVGRQFTAEAVAALEEVHQRGELERTVGPPPGDEEAGGERASRAA